MRSVSDVNTKNVLYCKMLRKKWFGADMYPDMAPSALFIALYKYVKAGEGARTLDIQLGKLTLYH